MIIMIIFNLLLFGYFDKIAMNHENPTSSCLIIYFMVVLHYQNIVSSGVNGESQIMTYTILLAYIQIISTVQ